MLDNGKAGYEATRAIELEYLLPSVRDFSTINRGIRTLNDYCVLQEAGTEEQQPTKRQR